MLVASNNRSTIDLEVGFFRANDTFRFMMVRAGKQEDVVNEKSADRLRSLELASMMRSGRSFTLAYLAFMAVVSALIWQSVPTHFLVVWCAIFLGYIVVRTKASNAYLADPRRDDIDSVRRWRWFIYLSSAVQGSIIGSTAYLFLPGMELVPKVLLTCLIVIYCVRVGIHAAGFPAAVVLITGFALVPLAIAWRVLPSPYMTSGPFALVLVVAFGSLISRKLHLAAKEGWRQIIANELLAEELGQANRRLQELASSRNRLFAVAGHDLRQPVHAMGLAIEQLNENDPPLVLRQHFDQLRESAHLVSEMLQDLMDVSNLERQDFALHVGSVHLKPVFEQLRLSQEAHARRKGIELEIASGDSLAVHSDPNLLRRILLNLVGNAVKYTRKGKVSVTCGVANGAVSIRVVDTGIGIAQAHLVNIFNDYTQVDGSQGGSEGIGLGLSVVRRAVDLLGHQLSVTSEVGVGSVFELRVPAAEWIAPPSRPEQPASGPARKSDTQIVLLVEDDHYARRALTSLLQQWGYVPVGAATAKEALALLERGEVPVLIIADLQLTPHEDGFDAIALTREYAGNQRLPALLLTGDVRPALLPRAAEHSIEIAHKPVSPPVLKQKVQALLNNCAVSESVGVSG